jgi:molybdopterin synthase catalytic subunit
MTLRTEREWIETTPEPLPMAEATTWATRPECGAVVTFCGTVRDHSEGRPGVTSLEYELYETYAVATMERVARTARTRYPELGRIALIHRTGALVVEEISVLVVVSAPHRAEAFEAARLCIDAIKASVPVWKRETWAGGSDWSACTHEISDLPPLATS